MNLPSRMSETEAYTAGLFDGEGCVSLGQRGEAYLLQVVVVNTHKPVLDWLHSIWGGRVYLLKTGGNPSAKGRPAHWSPCWEWYLNRPDMQPFLSAIEPHLIVKKRPVLIALEFLKTPAIGPRRAELFAELRGLPKPTVEPPAAMQLALGGSEYFGD